MTDSINIEIDGNELELGSFVTKIFLKLIKGMIESLDGIAGTKNVKIEVSYNDALEEY